MVSGGGAGPAGGAPWLVGFDADDTLWHNERAFRVTEDRVVALLADHAEGDHLRDRLLEAQRRNVAHYGFGVKAFTLSVIETAIEVTDARVPAAAIARIMDWGREMLAHPIELLPHAREAVEAAASLGRVVLITKGDLLDQERKLAQSGLGELFDAVEVVSDKTEATYARLFRRHGAAGGRAAMVGNSLRSDVLPALAAGGWGVHVPAETTWALEVAEAPTDHARFRAIAHLGELPPLLSAL